MSTDVNRQVTKVMERIPKMAVGILLGIMVFGLFIVGYDQGHLFSIAQGEQAYEELWMHEFYHDMRHAAGFPCH
ncbi:MAG: CbtB-domain containing protein [Nitrososphaera sp.]|jgi:uncharacterized membrane protein SpoIIM required for sporulation